MSGLDARVVQMTISPTAAAEGWRLATVYGVWPPCSGCGIAFAQGEALLVHPGPKLLLCGRCGTTNGLTVKEVVH